MAKHNPYSSKGHTFGQIGTAGHGTAHIIKGGKPLCMKHPPLRGIKASGATTICSRCVKIARVDAGVPAKVPGGRKSVEMFGLMTKKAAPR